MDHEKHPPIPAALMAHLEASYPEKSPSKGETLEALIYRGAQRDVVRSLRVVFDLQNETILNVPSD